MSLGLLRPLTDVSALFVAEPPKTNRGRPREFISPYPALLPGRCWCRSKVTSPSGIIAHADATKYIGPGPVVAHPPCRAWAKLAQMAKPREGERGLALYALACVRRFGGVLEHPEGSGLWNFAGLPRPFNDEKWDLDPFGGWTLSIDQLRFGHRCEKRTWLYICNAPPFAVFPLIPPASQSPATHSIAGKGLAKGGKPQISHFEREHTPPRFAEFLIEVARRCWV